MDSQSTLKPDQVIKELWPAETRTKRSGDVATEMNRLRHALEAYYNEEGSSDPILIVLPNRSAAAGDGRPESRWIAAVAREEAREQVTVEHESASQPEIPEAASRVGYKTAAAIVLCVIIVVVAYISRRALTVNGEPKSGRLEGSALVITNANGNELWRKVFAQGFGPAWYYDDKNFGPRIWFADLEGKGHTSVLFSYLPVPDAKPHSSTLICYSDRGKEEWRWTPGRDLPEVAGEVAFKTFSVRVLKATEKQPSRIAVLSNHDPWWGGPSQIALLDTNGKLLSDYWQSGGLRDMVLAGMEGGREEIIATGVAHGYESQATLVVLDPDRVFGASTEIRPEFQIHGVGVAQEKLRLLFPRSDLNRASFQYNYGIEPTFQNGHLQIKVLECLAPVGCPVRYEFDDNFDLTGIHPIGDEFKSVHDRFYQNGKDAHALSAEEQASFLKVRCLTGCKSDFVPVAQTYDPAASFEKGWTTRSNPNGPWSYGYSSGFTDPATLYDKTVRNGINGPNAKYWVSSTVNAGTSPAVEHNDGPAYDDSNVDFQANEFLLVAGVRGQYSESIFTAPEDGAYSIAGNFRGAQYDVGTVVGIVANRRVVFSSSVTSVGQLAPFHLMLNLQAGNTVVFSVGPGSGAQNTALSATITKPCAPTDRPTVTLEGEILCSVAAPLSLSSIKSVRMRTP